jgi:SAM-dependent methyltransferase
MRTTLLTLLERLSQAVEFPGPIFEFGSYRVPGQQHLPRVQDFFPRKSVVGCDIRTGPGVDRIEDLHSLTLPTDSIGTALMFDTIEHVRDPWRAMSEIHRCLKPGGLLVMSSVWFFPIHAYPDDYWRFTSSAFRELMRDFHVIAAEMCGLAKMPHTVVGIGSKGSVDPGSENAIVGTLSKWKENGARTWKEVVLDACPPVLLYPLYQTFLRTLQVINREKPEPNDASSPTSLERATERNKPG